MSFQSRGSVATAADAVFAAVVVIVVAVVVVGSCFRGFFREKKLRGRRKPKKFVSVKMKRKVVYRFGSAAKHL